MTQLKTMQKKLLKKMKTGHKCPCCGNPMSNPNTFYSSLTTLLTMRFMRLLNDNKGESYFDGVLDCIDAVFGVSNSWIREALKGAGYLEKFDERFKARINEIGIGSEWKDKCYKCGKFYADYELTIECVSPYRTEYVCDDCVADTGDGKE
jgi:hypothetical protein